MRVSEAAERGLAGEVAYRPLDCFQHPLHPAKHFLIAEPQHAKSITFQKFLTQHIFFGGVLVDCSIDFDDQLRLVTEKIDHKAINRVLAAKLHAQPAISQPLPK